MKVITVRQIESVLDHIMHDREELAKLKKETFMGVNQHEVMMELEKRLGVNWVLQKDPPVKLSKDDIIAVANNRFFRKLGMKLLMAWAIVILAFAILTLTLRILPLPFYYGLSGIVTAVFLFVYSKKQNRMRNELKQAAYGSDRVEADRG